MYNLNSALINAIFNIALINLLLVSVCEGWSPVCVFTSDKNRVWIRILRETFRDDILYPIGDYDGNRFIRYGLKKLWIPCGRKNKEYMVLGWLKNIYGRNRKIQRGRNYLLWIAVFRKGHMLAQMGGQWIDIQFDLCNIRTKFFNHIDRRTDLYPYSFPNLDEDPRCTNAYFIQYAFYELKENVSLNDIVERTVCPENNRVFRTDHPMVRLNEITKNELGRVSLVYCRHNGSATTKQENQNIEDVVTYEALCRIHPLKKPKVVKNIESSGLKPGDASDQQEKPVGSSIDTPILSEEEKEALRKEMEKPTTASDLQKEQNYSKPVGCFSNNNQSKSKNLSDYIHEKELSLKAKQGEEAAEFTTV